MTFMKNPLYARDRLKEGLSSCALAAKAIQSFIPTDLKTEMYRWAVLETILMDNGTWEAAYFERVRAQLRIRSLPLSDEEFAAYHLMMAKAIGLAIVLPHLQAISSSK